MNREIKFRAWDGIEHMAYQGTPDLETIQSFMHHFGNEILMQYTGLKDKNGKEIYEGDIIMTETDKLMVISWSEKFASFVIDRAGWMFSHWFGESCDNNKVEIIGNIYENKEILK